MRRGHGRGAEEVRLGVSGGGGDDRPADWQTDRRGRPRAGDRSRHVGQLGDKDRLARGEEPDPSKVDVAYVRRLERELAEVRMEGDVLRRCVVLWVKEATR